MNRKIIKISDKNLNISNVFLDSETFCLVILMDINNKKYEVVLSLEQIEEIKTIIKGVNNVS